MEKDLRKQFNVNELKEALDEFFAFSFIDSCKLEKKELIDLLVPNKFGEEPEYQNFHEATGGSFRSKKLIYSFSVYDVEKDKASFTCKSYFELKNDFEYDCKEVYDTIHCWVERGFKRVKNLTLEVFSVTRSEYDKERFVVRFCFKGEFV